MPGEELLRWAASVLPEYDPAGAPAPHRLAGAGSDRRLHRLFLPAGTVLLVENPCPPSEGPNENDSFVYLSGHLRSLGLPAPGVVAYERGLGAYLMEDLDDDDLYGKIAVGLSAGEVRGLYEAGVALLARMQTAAARGLDAARLHSPPRYDRDLMLRWESGYFQRELVEGLLGLAPPSPRLVGEYERLADLAGEARGDFFLHRDFQSRNLKLYAGELWVIDFQGARLGPPQYDLASFLLDPYVELPAPLRRDLVEEYLLNFLPRSGMTRGEFLAPFPFVAAHRLMQALGAYAFLGRVKGKREFLPFIAPALRLLGEVTGSLPPGEFPELSALARRAAARHGGGELAP